MFASSFIQRLLTLVAGLCLLLLTLNVSGHQSDEVRTLAPQIPVERELAGRQTHPYQIALAANQFVKIDAEQRGVDIAIKLIAPDGKAIANAENGRGRFGTEL